MDELYDRLLKLSAEEWTVLRWRLPDLNPHLPSPLAPRSDQARALVGAMSPKREAELRKLLEDLYEESQKPQENLEGWLQKLHRRHGQLRVLGLKVGDGDYRLDLDQVYVELEIRRSSTRHMGPGKELFGGGREEDPIGHQRDLPGALALLEKERNSLGLRGLALIGLPGTGKTTALQRLWCDQYRRGKDDPEAPLPLLLRCATLQHLGMDRLKAGELPAIAELEARIDGYPGAGRSLWRRGNGRLLVMLDGLDELKEPSDREKVALWLIEETEHWPEAQFVLTCRRAAWGPKEAAITGERLVPFDILALTQTSIHAYIEKWFPLVARKNSLGLAADQVEEELAEARRKSARLIQVLEGKTDAEIWRIYGLTGNPLTLSTVCLVFYHHGKLPQERGRLYGLCLEVLLRGRQRPGHPNEFEKEEGVRLLGPLAWRMQQGEGALDSPKEVHKAVVLEELERSRGALERLRNEPAEGVLRRLCTECAVLYSADDVQYQFLHLTFQEYLAAEYAREASLATQLAAWAGNPRWREPILLAMADRPMRLAFWKAFLAGPVAPHHELLGKCLLEDNSETEPFVEFLLRGRPPKGWLERAQRSLGFGKAVPNAADLTTVLSAFRVGAQPAIREAAAILIEHPDGNVRRLALEMSGKIDTSRESATGSHVGFVDDPRGFVGTGAARKAVKLGVGSRWRSGVLGMEFVWVPPGTFLMGATAEEGKEGFDAEAGENEGPPHRVQITRGFWMGRFPVTNAQVRRFVMDGGSESFGSLRNPGFDGAEQPAVELRWHDAQAFCQWAGKLVGHPVTLPTEAEWEYAARGEEGRKYPWGGEKPALKRAWYGGFREHPEVNAPAPVGGRSDGAGPFGAEEQAGNVWEWCFDPYEARNDPSGDKGAEGAVADPGLEAVLVRYSSRGDTSDKKGLQDDKRPFRVLRGGAWLVVSRGLRAACRGGSESQSRNLDVGFRVVCRVPEL